jgi:hypothetical protein
MNRMFLILRKKFIPLALLTVLGMQGYGQHIDSIYFHLYTDSLKKGVHNYINVDGKLSNGKWMPLTDKEIKFSSSYGVFVGNSLIIDSAFTGEKVTVRAVLRSNPKNLERSNDLHEEEYQAGKTQNSRRNTQPQACSKKRKQKKGE